MLGHGFLWVDLVRYVSGVLIAVVTDMILLAIGVGDRDCGADQSRS